MDGLFAWAADVVGAGADEELVLRFSPEQIEEMKRLKERATDLQRSIDELRQMLPPASTAQRMPHLHAESLASQSALALELHAHSASRIQAQIRESSLQSDIAAYKKALVTTEQQVAERALESQELEKSFEELGDQERRLQEECDALEKVIPEHDSDQQLELLDDDISFQEELKAELTKWQTMVAQTRKELSSMEYEALAWPSSAQREKDLERRLGALVEQLAAKQAQAEKLILERDALELRVKPALESRRKSSSKNGTTDTEQRRSRSSRSSKFQLRALTVAYIFALHVVVLLILSRSSS